MEKSATSFRTRQRRRNLKLKLNDVILYLKKQGYPIESTLISFYSNLFSAFVNCNSDPLSDYIQLSEEDLEVIDNAYSLRIKFERSLTDVGADRHDEEVSDPDPIQNHVTNHQEEGFEENNKNN